MATTKNITMKQFNGSDYDTLYPKTQSSQIIGSIPIASGGTGGTNATSGMYNLLNGMSTIAPVTNDLFPFKDVSGSTSGLVTLSNLITAMGNNGVITTSNLSTQASNLGFSKIQTGSYAGTGTYGESNPCSLTFDFVPQLIILWRLQGDAYRGNYQIYPVSLWVWPRGRNIMSTNSNRGILYVTYNDKSISWYAQGDGVNDTQQLNGSTDTYYYLAIG